MQVISVKTFSQLKMPVGRKPNSPYLKLVYSNTRERRLRKHPIPCRDRGGIGAGPLPEQLLLSSSSPP
jgi:hypothetical protein